MTCERRLQTRGRILLKKGYTLEQMGSYEAAIETLQEAAPWIDRVADTVTGEVHTYYNPDRTAFAPVQDTSALACGN